MVAVSVGLLLINRWFGLVVVPLVLVAVFKAAVLYATTRLNYDMRAQNVRVTQGQLQRLFGFSNMEVETAGGGGSTGSHGEQSSRPHRAVLRGLDDPAHVRGLILEQLRRHRTAGLGDPDDQTAVHPVLTPSLLNEILDEARKLRRAFGSR